MAVNNLSGSIPKELGKLDNAWWLNLSNNNLDGTIPEEISQMDNLRQLWLGSNQLTGEIPFALGNTTTLTQILLENNLLTGSIPAELGQLSALVDLRLYENQIGGTIPKELMQLDKLQRVYLNQNQIVDLPLGLTFSSPVLTNLSLASNKLTFEDLEDKMNLTDIDFHYSPQAKIGQAQTIQLNSGDNYTLNVLCGGTANSYQWFFNNQALSSSGDNSSYELSNLTIENAGEYFCRVTNSIVPDLTIESEPIMLQITQANNAPTNISLSNNSIDEEKPIGTVIGTLTTSDADTGDNFTYSLVAGSGDSNNRNFQISGDQLVSNEVFDFETKASYTIRIQTSDSGDANFSKAFTIYVNDVDENICNREQDSLALVAFYHATNGDSWTRKDNWLTGNLDTWYGIGTDGCNVKTINLYINNLEGSIPDEIGQLKELNVLNLGGNALSGVIPDAIWNLTNLYQLEIMYTKEITGVIPPEIGQLVKLTSLNLSDNKLSGTIPSEIGNLNNLVSLDLMMNDLEGNIPTQVGSLKKMFRLNLMHNNLIGEIPSEIGQLSFLEQLNLSNNMLSGPIPSEIGLLSNLKELTLEYNDFKNSTIPPEIGQLSNLTFLSLSQCQLSGAIPNTIGYLTKLKALHLADNNLSEQIPSEIGQLKNLEYIYLYGNELSGPIPIEFGSLEKISDLNLRDNNLSGSFPVSILNLPGLSSINIQNNQIEDFLPQHTIPAIKIGKLGLDLRSNKLTFEDVENKIEANLNWFYYSPQAKIGQAQTIQLNSGDNYTLNVLCGGTANSYQWFFNNQALSSSGDNSSYELSNLTIENAGEYFCRVTNSIVPDLTIESEPIMLQITQANNAPTNISLSNNSIDEEKPIGTVIGTLTTSDADTGDNFTYSLVAGSGDSNNRNFQISGDQLVSNEVFDFETKASYTIRIQTSDSGDANFSKAFTIYVNDVDENICNREQDSLALVAFYHATNGDSWTRKDNWLTGNLDTWYGIGTDGCNVTSIQLSYNQLSGHIPAEIGKLTKLVSINLLGGTIEGGIPDEFENLVLLEHLVLKDNKLEGAISQNWISKLPNLKTLNLTNNPLGGSIPGEIENLKKLTYLGLNLNNLSGTIPPEIGNLVNLKELDLGQNELSGSIPKEIGNLNKITRLSFGDNNLTGVIPSEIGQLSNIEELILFDNQLTGNLPVEITALKKLERLALTRNMLGDQIPVWLQQLNTLKWIELDENNFIGDVPEEVLNMPTLERILLSHNQLTNFLPSKEINNEKLDWVFLDHNHFTFEDLEDKIDNNYSRFKYAPQAKIGQQETITKSSGENYTLDIFCGGTANVYQWYHNNQAIGTASPNAAFELYNLSEANEGAYHCEITNTIVPDLTIESEPITLQITEVNQAPTDILLSNATINEEEDANTLVGILSTTDADDGDTFTYTLMAGTGDTDNNSFLISGDQLQSNEVFDYETKSVYSIRVRTTDFAGTWFEKVFAVFIEDLDEKIVSEELFVPDAFSPNNDGANDLFIIKGLAQYPDAHLDIYDRFGTLVYSKDNYGNDTVHRDGDQWWNGSFEVRGKKEDDILPRGTYFLILNLNKDLSELENIQKKTIFLNK
jgi:gliding motility-associated-like protein